MKKLLAVCLAALLLVGITACGDDTHQPDDAPSTTVTTEPTATTPAGTDVPEGSTTVPSLPDGSDATQTTGGSTAPARPSNGTSALPSTTTTAPTGVTVPIGTKPPVTTTQTSTTTTVGNPSVGGSSTGTTATTTTAPTTTAPTVKPTEPVVQGPYIVLPAIGSDIDVTKQKDRIRVSGVAAWFNDDGTIGVQLTFKNYTSNWITEETDYVTYTCYDKNGKVVQRATNLMIGVIDTKKHVEKTFTFNVPANTAEVRITKSKITYWTEWA